MVLVTAELRLELSPPDIEELLRVGGEAEEGALFRGELFGLKRRQVETGELTVDGECAGACINIRPPINVAPLGERIGEDGELKALNQAVITAAGEGLVQVGIQRPRLNAAENGDTSRLDMQGAAAETVVDVGPAPIPGFAIEAPVILVARTIHEPEESTDLIA